MAISFQQRKSGSAVNAGAITLTFTSTPQAGDLILVIHADGDTTDNVMPAPTSAGYTDVGTSEQYANNTNDSNSKAWYKYAAGTETNVVLAGTGGGSNCATTAACMIFRGVAPVAQGGPFSTAIVKTTGTGSAHADPPSIATAANDCVVIMGAGAHATTGITFTAPANYTTNAEPGTAGTDTISSGAGMAYRLSGYANPENPAAFTASATAAGDSWAAISLALKAAVPTAYTMDTVAANITFAGGADTLKRGFPLTSTAASITFGGGAHTLTYTPGTPPPTNYTMTAVAANITFTGGAHTLAPLHHYTLDTTAANITFAGGADTLKRGFPLTAAAADIAFAGGAHTLTYTPGLGAPVNYTMAALPANITLTGGSHDLTAVIFVPQQTPHDNFAWVTGKSPRPLPGSFQNGGGLSW